MSVPIRGSAGDAGRRPCPQHTVRPRTSTG